MINRIIPFLEKELYESSHDIDHSFRVLKNAQKLSVARLDVDQEILAISCILHDIAKAREDKDKTKKIDHCILGTEMARNILNFINYPQMKIEIVCEAIINHRTFSPEKHLSIESQLLYDAGILENIGAIGIARTFMIAGEFQEKLYVNDSLDDYIKKNVLMPQRKIIDYSLHAPNVEFELNWKNSEEFLYTKEAKEEARKRISFSRMFFTHLKEELGFL